MSKKTVTSPKQPVTSASVMAQRVEKAKAYIVANFLKGRGCNLLGISGQAGVSAFHFHRIFTDMVGETPKRMATRLQVEHAKRMLLEGTSCADTADKCGFAHQSHFTSRFKQITGTTPMAWLGQQQLDAAAGDGATKQD